MMLIFGIVLTILFCLMGIMLIRGKWAFLIAGYNTMSREQKRQYDEKSLCHFMGKMMFGFAFGSIFLILSGVFANPLLHNIGFAIIIVLSLFLAVYLNTGNRFKKR